MNAMHEEFYSEEHDGPFTHCSKCSYSLEDGHPYQVNKSWKDTECIFEYAFCHQCRESLLEEFSTESKLNLIRFQQKHFKVHVKGITQCSFCEASRMTGDTMEFTTTALFTNASMLDSLMICFDCQASMHEVLSVETKDVRRRFFESIPGVPPDWEIWEPEDSDVHRVTAPLNQVVGSSQPVSTIVSAFAILGTPEM